MKRVTVNGIPYTLPFEHLFPAFTPARFAELKADIETHGVIQAVVVANTPTWGRCVVEGMHRSLIAEPLDIDVPVVSLGDVADAHARDRCRALNIKRRHMTADEEQLARAGRIVRVAALSAGGKTIREISNEVGVCKSQVQRDLQLVPHGTRKRKRRPPAARALANVTSLAGSLKAVLRDKARRAALEAIAKQHGVPFDEGGNWSLFEKMRLVLRDLAQGGAQA